MCTHHIPEYRVNMHKLSPKPQLDRGVLPLFKRSGGTSKRVRALVRIGHSSAESNKQQRDDLNYLIPSLSLRSASLRQNQRKYEKWDQRRWLHNAAVCCSSYNTDRNLTSVGPTHNILRPNTTRSSIQHIGGREDRFQLTDDRGWLLKCHKNKNVVN